MLLLIEFALFRYYQAVTTIVVLWYKFLFQCSFVAELLKTENCIVNGNSFFLGGLTISCVFPKVLVVE